MRQSKLLIRTSKEAPKDARVASHKYLVRGDFIEQSFSGVWRFLALGWLVHEKIKNIIKQEMLGLAGQEIYLPALQNKSLWLETGRWQTIDPPLFKFKDRHQKETALGSTHEEEIVDIARKRIKSWQDLPWAIFQIQNKFRNEMRPSGGLLRTKEFLMKDLYSFHSNEDDLEKFYQKVQESYRRIFKKCGLETIIVKASGGTIGGKKTDEFMVISEVGEDKIALCQRCNFAANIETIGKTRDCPKCQKKLEFFSSIEIGHTFNLGTKYSKIMGARFQDKDGKIKPAVMGCYGIGLGRLMATIVEINHDKKGIIWPKAVAPFQVHLIEIQNPKSKIQKVKKASEKLYKDLCQKGIEALYDDRDKSAGEKFADADLIGIPMRMVVSERTLAKNCAEIKERAKRQVKLIKLNLLNSYIRKKFVIR